MYDIMKKLIKIISLTLVFSVLLSAFPVVIYGADDEFSNDKGYALVVWNDTEMSFSSDDYGNRLSKALRFALEYAGSVATEKNPAVVKLQAGNYLFDNHLYIYSNTTLDVTGSYIKYPENSILSNKYDNGATSASGYNGGKNMTIIGGTWDICGDYETANTINSAEMTATFRFAHCQNLTIKNCTFKNNYSGHDIEVGGVNNLKVLNCTFKNDKDVNKYKIVGGKEAIQLDINTKIAMSSFPGFDSTATANVIVSGCTFKNKFRGVGSHHATIGKPFNNINIYNNTFDNLNGLAVYLIYTNNAKVYNNKIINCGSGIYVGSVIDSDALKNTFNYSCTKANDTVKTSKSYIYGNDILIRSNNNTISYRYGIRADGRHLKATKTATNVKKGTYYVYGVTIGTSPDGKVMPNKISGNFSCGISLRYAKNSKVANNTVNMNTTTNDLCYGIEVRSSKTIKVLKNTIKNTKRKNTLGIMVSDLDFNGVKTSSLTISNNKIYNYNKKKKSSKDNFGIRLYNDTTGVTISNNIIKSGNACICASGYSDKSKSAKKYKITGNTLDSYAEKTQILFRSVKLKKTIKNNYKSSGKKSVVVIT